MRLALLVAYDGSRFSGSQRQPDTRTVEGDLLAALEKVGAAPKELRSAGRTDAGVSAAGNVFAADVDFREEEIVGAANAHLSDAWVLARAAVEPGFDPRRAAAWRRYAYYHAPLAPLDLRAAAEAFARFRGEHDFSRFARVEPHRAPLRRVDEASVDARGGLVVFEVRGPSFLWNQVRRMVAAALAVGESRATLADVEAGLSGAAIDLGVAPAAGLVLQEVHVPQLRWEIQPADRARAARALSARTAEAAVALARARALAGFNPR